MSGESGEHRRLERFNFDSESYSLLRGNDIALVIIVVMLVVARYRENTCSDLLYKVSFGHVLSLMIKL